MPQIHKQDTSAKPKSTKPARLFIAILLDKKTLDFLDTAVTNLRDLSSGGRFVRQESLHLTLAFLGQVERNRIDELKKLLAKVSRGADGCEIDGLRSVGETNLNKDEPNQRFRASLTLTKTGRFKQRKDSTCWIGVETAPWLVEIHDKLVAALLEAGFSVDEKPFKPHITVGRSVTLTKGFNFEQWQVDSLPYSTPVSAIHLIESSFQQGQLTYTSLHEQPILRPRPPSIR